MALRWRFQICHLAFLGGETKEEAPFNAVDCLEEIIAALMKEKKDIPHPSAATKMLQWCYRQYLRLKFCCIKLWREQIWQRLISSAIKLEFGAEVNSSWSWWKASISKSTEPWANTLDWISVFDTKQWFSLKLRISSGSNTFDSSYSPS